MAMRVCAEPGCPALTPCRRCPEHERDRDKARGNKQQRGYGRAFDKAKLTPAYVNATHCTHCGQPFTASNPKTAGHVKALRNAGQPSDVITPQCRRCNYGWRKTGL